MAKQIKHEDLIQKEVLQPTIEQAKLLLETLNAVEKQMVDLIKVTQTAQKENKKFSSSEEVMKQKKVTQELSEAEKILLKARQDKAKLTAKIRTLDAEEVKNGEKLKKLARDRKKSLEDLAIIQDKNAGTLQKLAAQNRILRREREKLNLDTEKGRKRLQEINTELDKNNTKITQNSDKLKQQRMNVGNYSNSIKDAVNSSGLFSSQLATLQRIQATLNALVQKNTAETTANAAAQQTAASASGKFSKALRVLKFALISTGIGAIAVALGTVVTAFATTQRGADAFTSVLRPLTALFQRFVGFIQDTGFKVFDRLKAAFNDPKQAVVDLASAIKDNLVKRFESIAVFGSAISKLFKGEFKEGFAELGDASVQLATGVENASEKINGLAEETSSFFDESIKQGKELDEIIKEFERREIDLTVPLAQARLEFEKFRAIAQDQTKTDQERIEALNEAEKQQMFIIENEQKLLDLQIERLEIEQSFNDTSREEELELEKLKAERLQKEAAAQKKINSLIAQRSSIEKRIETARQKELEDLQKIGEQLQSNNKFLKEGTEEQIKQTDAITKAAEARQKASEEATKQANEQAKADKEAAEAFDKRVDKAIEASKEIKSAFAEAINEEIKLQNEAADNEIQKRTEAIQFNQELVAAGNADAAEQLQFEKEQLAKAEVEKANIAKREAAAKRAIQLVDTYFAAFERRLDDPETPTGQAALAALGDVTKGVATSELAKALAGASFAYEGTENVDGKQAIYDRKSKIDRYLYWLHPNERVMTDKQNAKVGNMSNDQLANLAFDYQNGTLKQPYEFQTSTYLSNINGMTDNALTRFELHNLKAAVNQNAQIIASAINDKPVASTYIDSALQVVEEIKRNGRTTRTTHKRF